MAYVSSGHLDVMVARPIKPLAHITRSHTQRDPMRFTVWRALRQMLAASWMVSPAVGSSTETRTSSGASQTCASTLSPNGGCQIPALAIFSVLPTQRSAATGRQADGRPTVRDRRSGGVAQVDRPLSEPVVNVY